MSFAQRPLAFVDLETTGLGPATHRIAEIGVVTLDRGRVEEWASLVNPGRLPYGQRAIEGVPEEAFANAPRFAEIADDLARRLEGKLLVAHNARFDYAFLKAEFDRAGVPFEAPALCTVMLSRKLYPMHEAHNLDALMARHGLTAEVRHRALPDARLLHQFWEVLASGFSARRLWSSVEKLLAEPLLPPHLDLCLIQDLPEKCGAYVMRDADRRALRIARATNLRREVRDYFRLDRISATGAKLSYAVRQIEWHVADGDLSARLLELALAEQEPAARPSRSQTACSVRIDPASKSRVATVVSAEELVVRGEALFGLFASDRKAANALARLAGQKKLCHRLLGLEPAACGACRSAADACAPLRPQQLMKTLTALTTLRLPSWPYDGPVGVREGRTVHVFDQWQRLGSARTASEIAELAELRPRGFDHATFNLLLKALPRVPAKRLKRLRRAARPADDPARTV
jgi:DNA polymerase-3 subunit epsilon